MPGMHSVLKARIKVTNLKPKTGRQGRRHIRVRNGQQSLFLCWMMILLNFQTSLTCVPKKKRI